MIEVSNIEVRSFDLDHLDIYWDVADTDEMISRYSFEVLRSVDGAGGPFDVISEPFDSLGSFRDPEVALLHKWRQYFYKVRVTSKDDSDLVREFGPEWLRSKPDRIALEIQRRMHLLMKELVGRPSILFPALTSGQRCPICWDRGTRGNTIGAPKQQNCQTCYDTTFVGGYQRPILLYIQFDPAPAGPQRMDITERATVNTSGRTSAFPPLKPRDMIVDPQNKRWQVERVPTTQKRGAIVHQEPMLHEIPKPDIRYTAPVVNPELLDESQHREYTRPMTTLGN